VEVNHVRERERAFAVRRAAEPGTSPAQGKDQRTDGGGMKAGLTKALQQVVSEVVARSLGVAWVKRHTALCAQVFTCPSRDGEQ
jgi:hypothetical protein